MRDFYSDINKVLSLLDSTSSSLKELAYLSGREVFSFYRGADLSGLDLSFQDLTGMNFDGANFLSSSLSGISYDMGAFNGSILPDGFRDLADEYDGYLYDILLPQMSRISLHAQLREESLESYFLHTNSSYSNFSLAAGLNLETLRRARRGEVISGQTLRKIASEMQSRFQSISKAGLGHPRECNQPMVQFLSLKRQGGFTCIPQKDLLKIIDISRRVDISRYGDEVIEEHLGNYWAVRPETLLWLGEYYDSVDFYGLPLDLEDQA